MADPGPMPQTHPAEVPAPATHLVRTLGTRSLVLFGLAYMTPIIVLGIFGIVASVTAGATPAAYLLALIAMLFTASSYGRMARAFPVAGSAYTYVRRAVDSRAGFLVGWAVLLDYVFLPMVIWLFGAAYLNAQFPGVPNAVWILAFIVVTTTLNILGIRVAEKANYALMAFQLLVIAIFVALSIASLATGTGAGTLFSLAPFSDSGDLSGRNLRRCGHRRLFLPRLRCSHHADRGDGQPAAYGPAGHPAGRAHRGRDLRAGGLHDPARTPRRGVRERRRGRLGVLRHRVDHRRAACSAPSSWPAWWWLSSLPVWPLRPAPPGCSSRWAGTAVLPRRVFGGARANGSTPRWPTSSSPARSG